MAARESIDPLTGLTGGAGFDERALRARPAVGLLDASEATLHAPAARAVRDEPAPRVRGPSARAIELAEHGAPPSIFLEVPYAFAVVRRNRALRARIPELRRLAEAAAQDADAACLALGRAVHANRQHPRAPELGTPLKIAFARHHQLQEYEREIAEAEARVAQLREAHTLAAAEAEMGRRPVAARAASVQAEVVALQREYEAHAAALHEARAALTSLGSDASADARVELEARCTLRKVEADAVVAQIDARTPELNRLRAELAAIDRPLDAVRAKVEEAEASRDAVRARVEAESASTRARFEEALRDLAEAALESQLDCFLAPSEARQARVRNETYAAQARELKAHEVALTLHYPNAVRRGFALLGLCGVGVIAEFLVLLS